MKQVYFYDEVSFIGLALIVVLPSDKDSKNDDEVSESKKCNFAGKN
jgi:hypothetical protein